MEKEYAWARPIRVHQSESADPSQSIRTDQSESANWSRPIRTRVPDRQGPAAPAGRARLPNLLGRVPEGTGEGMDGRAQRHGSGPNSSRPPPAAARRRRRAQCRPAIRVSGSESAGPSQSIRVSRFARGSYGCLPNYNSIRFLPGQHSVARLTARRHKPPATAVGGGLRTAVWRSQRLGWLRLRSRLWRREPAP